MPSACLEKKEDPNARSREAFFRVLLVDDHPAVRHGIATLISCESDFEVCGEAGSVSEGLALIRALEPDAVVVDISLPDASGLELIKTAREEKSVMPMMVVSVHDETSHALRSLQAGANGFFRKSDPPQILVEGLRKILDGKTFISPRVAGELIFKVLESKKTGKPSLVQLLSTRQLEVFEMIGAGRTTKEIGARLNMSPKTVETHRGHIKEKFGMLRTSELVRFAADCKVQADLDG